MFFTILRASRAAAVASLIFAAGAVSAATLTLESSFTLQKSDNGPETPGLSGALILLKAEFAEGILFTRDGFDVPRAVASMVTFTISGASGAMTNGVYMPSAALGLFANGTVFDGLLTTGPSTNVFIPGADATFFGIAGLANQVRLDAGGTVGSHALGDLLTLHILQGVKLASGGVVLFSKSGQGGTSYSVNNVTTRAYSDAAAVPLPAALPLLGAGLSALAGFAARRRQKAKPALV